MTYSSDTGEKILNESEQAQEDAKHNENQALLAMIDLLDVKLLGTLNELNSILESNGYLVNKLDVSRCMEACRENFDELYGSIKEGLK